MTMSGNNRSIAFIVSLFGGLAAASCAPPERQGASNEGPAASVRQAIEPGTGAPDLVFNTLNEPAIAVNPTNPNNIVFAIGPTMFFSNDGGASFPIVTNADIPS